MEPQSTLSGVEPLLSIEELAEYLDMPPMCWGPVGTAFEIVAVYIGMPGLDFRVTAPATLVEHLRVVGERYRRAIADA